MTISSLIARDPVTRGESVMSSNTWAPHMYLANYCDGQWNDGAIVEQGPIAINPAASGIQFGQSVFEGICVERSPEGKRVFFRLEHHYERLMRSCRRLAIPELPWSAFRQAVESVTAEGSQWKHPFTSDIIYLRPLVFGTTSLISPKAAETYVFVILAAPFRRPFKEEGLTIVVNREYGRTANRGLGWAKTGANYAPIHLPTSDLANSAIDSILWLDSERGNLIKEATVANIFFETRQGLITPQLDGHILPGITRDSVIELTKSEFHLQVIECDIKLSEISSLAHKKELVSMFVSSTARGLHPIGVLLDGTEEIRPNRVDGIYAALAQRLDSIKQGKAPDSRGWTEIVD